jgi:hypothetical protein
MGKKWAKEGTLHLSSKFEGDHAGEGGIPGPNDLPSDVPRPDRHIAWQHTSPTEAPAVRSITQNLAETAPSVDREGECRLCVRCPLRFRSRLLRRHGLLHLMLASGTDFPGTAPSANQIAQCGGRRQEDGKWNFKGRPAKNHRAFLRFL